MAALSNEAPSSELKSQSLIDVSKMAAEWHDLP